MPLLYVEPKLKDLPDSTVLEWWSSHPPGEDYRHCLQMARHRTIQTSLPEVRRDIKRRLRMLGLLPLKRPPTDADYQLAKITWRVSWFDTDII